MKLRSAVLAVASALGLAACDDTSGPDGPRALALSFTGLEPLQNGFHYEGWAIVDGTPRTTGKFNIGTGGAVVQLNGSALPNGEFRTDLELSRATAIVITIEPNGDTDAVPSATKVLAGAVSGGSATISISAPEALGNSFASASGRFVLATPTDADMTTEQSGLWFLDNSSGTPAAGLVLPTLPAGWKYEGWAVVGGTPLTTGRFIRPTGADERSPFSGPLPGPPFPGEDFLRNAPSGITFPLSLRGGMAVITVEPEPDDSPAPFVFKPLKATIAANAPVMTALSLANDAGSAPRGTAVIR